MSIITDTKSLRALCQSLAKHPFITIDTEFLRDKTYYPRLCLVQVAAPEGDPVAIDPLKNDMDLGPLADLLNNPKVIKVFHAARQDLEIFFNMTGKIPHPIFDTQVAAMVCGYGEQIGYNNLVQQITGVRLDKGAQFTDWSRRPLTNKQLSYALDDVTHLRQVYLHLEKELQKRGRHKWVEQEMEILEDPATYENHPEEAWFRLKIKSNKPEVLSVLQAVAQWREEEAQRRDVPRGRVMRDETVTDIAVHAPRKPENLAKARNMSSDLAHGKTGQKLLQIVEKALAVPKGEVARQPRKPYFQPELTPVLEMLKMLLRIQASEHEVATKLIANNADLELLAMDDKADIYALKGWRFEVFGKDALALKHGKIAIGLKNGQICKFKV